MQRLWGLKYMSADVKLKCYNAYVLAILMRASETWALTAQQMESSEHMHSSCSRQSMNGRLSDRHHLLDVEKAMWHSQPYN